MGPLALLVSVALAQVDPGLTAELATHEHLFVATVRRIRFHGVLPSLPSIDVGVVRFRALEPIHGAVRRASFHRRRRESDPFRVGARLLVAVDEHELRGVWPATPEVLAAARAAAVPGPPGP